MDSRTTQRLQKLFDDILTFSERQENGFSVISGISKDSRTILELFQKDDVLTKGSLQLALPKEDDLEMCKLSCWTTIYFGCLFPTWKDAGLWIQDAANKIGAQNREYVRKDFPHHRVFARFDRTALVFDFQFETI